MKNRSMSIYIAIGLIGVFIASFFIVIAPQVIVGLSVATLLFSIAQLLDSQINFWKEDEQDKIDRFNNVGNFNLSPSNLWFIKIYYKYQGLPQKQKYMYSIATVLYSVAFIFLFLSFVVPVNISERIGTSVTVLSSSLLFFSIWLVDKQQERKAQWDEVQMASMLISGTNTKTKKINKETDDGQNENGNP